MYLLGAGPLLVSADGHQDTLSTSTRQGATRANRGTVKEIHHLASERKHN